MLAEEVCLPARQLPDDLVLREDPAVRQEVEHLYPIVEQGRTHQLRPVALPRLPLAAQEADPEAPVVGALDSPDAALEEVLGPALVVVDLSIGVAVGVLRAAAQVVAHENVLEPVSGEKPFEGLF